MNRSSPRVMFEHPISKGIKGIARDRRSSKHCAQTGLGGWIRGFALASLVVGCAERVEYPYPPPPPPPPPPPAVEPEPLAEPYTQPASPGAASSFVADAGALAATQAPPASVGSASASSSGLVYSYATGQWVYVVDEGWVWVPQGATPVEMDGIPYVYLYTPLLGWTWYVSPWGWGPYFYGPWFRHPWHPYGWHGYWVAHPRVIERLGPHGGPGRR